MQQDKNAFKIRQKLQRDNIGDKGKAATINKIIWNVFGTVCLILVPCVSYVLFEYVTGNLATVPGDMAVWNIAWIYVLYLAVFAVSGTSRVAVPVVSVALLIISMAEAFVVGFRGRPIMLWDVMAFKTAATVAGNYAFVISHE